PIPPHLIVSVLFSPIPPPPRSPPFPYTTLFRSLAARRRDAVTDWKTHADRIARDGYTILEGAIDLALCDELRRDLERIERENGIDRKSTRLNSSHVKISYAVFCLKKKNTNQQNQ